MNAEAALSITFTEQEINKFWGKTEKREGSDCIWWTGLKKDTGYGIIYLNRKPKAWRAHRVSYLIHHGPIPAGMEILHSCNQPSCVNYNHLRAGTHAENMRQASEQKRLKGLRGDLSSSRRFPECRPRGRMNHFAKLNEEKVAEILFFNHWRAISTKELSSRYGVCATAIREILRRETWTHVPFPTIEILVQSSTLPVNTASRA